MARAHSFLLFRRSVGAVAACAVLTGVPGCDHEAPIGEPIVVKASYGMLGDTPGRYVYPRAIDSDGRWLWIIDRAGRVQRIDPETGAADGPVWRMPEIEKGKPVGVTVGPDYRTADPDDVLLYVPDTHYNRVMVYAPATRERTEPELVREIGTYGQEPGQFIYPTDVLVQYREGTEIPERYYVSEYGGNDRVSVFDDDWEFLFSFGRFGYGEDPSALEFNRAQAMAFVTVDGDRELLVTDDRNHRIGRFTPEGELIGWIGSPEASPSGALGSFQYPRGLEALDDGTILIAEFGANRVQRVDVATGQGLGAWGVPGRGDGELSGPWGVTVIGSRMYVLDSGNNRVVESSSPGRHDR